MARAVATRPMPIGGQGEGAAALARIGSDAGASDPTGLDSASGASMPSAVPGAGTAPLLAGGAVGATPPGTKPDSSSPVPGTGAGAGSSGAGEPDPTPGAGGTVLEGETVVTFFSRGGAGIGRASPATATRTSPVTQTGVWSLDAE